MYNMSSQQYAAVSNEKVNMEDTLDETRMLRASITCVRDPRQCRGIAELVCLVLNRSPFHDYSVHRGLTNTP